MIIFVGDKPSKKNTNPDIPFVGTKSYKTLLEWIYLMDIDISQVQLENSDKDSFCGYLKLCQIVGNDCLQDDIQLVVLGNNAEKIVKKFNHPYFKLPHPSGLNTKLNDKKWLSNELKRCKEWLNER